NSKDIALLTYGVEDNGLNQTYPTETSDSDSTVTVDDQLFEGLVQYRDDTKVVPLLATSWYNPNDTTWVFNIRHNVKFHSGRTLTAADVKYSLDYAVANQNSNSGGTSLSLASTIKSVKVDNPYQVTITTNGPDPVLLNRLAFLYIVDSKAKLGDPDAGTGPYIVKPGTKLTSGSAYLQAINDYWGGHIYTKSVHIIFYANEAKLTQDIQDKKLSIGGNFTNSQLAQITSSHDYINIHELGVDFLGLNTVQAGTPLTSLNARKAITYALNIPAIIKASDLKGTALNQLIPPTLPGYNPDIPAQVYNPTKAEQLLVGVPDLDKTLTLDYPIGDTPQVQEIAKELNAVGFHVQIQQQSLNNLINTLTSGTAQMFYIGYTTNTLDGLDIINNTVQELPYYMNAELTNLANQAASNLNGAARSATVQQMEQIIYDNAPVVPILNTTAVYVLTQPYVVTPNDPSAGIGAYFWQVYKE
ncbi:MAG TPA: ABC transporter substrate-binding protein, partial [Candidatus Sulfotelmatobacter sp.]|nr:ABC transporter substrate-binding protein [Candidatus Sulfotelmatobacter sp.]